MIKNLSFVSFSFIYINILGYAFHFFVSRKLSPVGYGEFMVLYSLMLTVGNVSSLLVPVTVKSVVENFSEKEAVLRFMRKIAVVMGIFFFLGGIALSPFIKVFLNVSNPYYLWAVSSVWLLIFIASVERGYLQANNLFNYFAFAGALEFTVRLFSVFVLLFSGIYVFGAVFSSFIGLSFSLAFLLYKNKGFRGKIKKLDTKKMLLIAMFVIPTGFFVYADDIFIRRIFDEHTAGIFASASILGKVLIWFSLSLFSVFFPKIVEHKDSKELISYSMKIIGLVLLLFFVSEIFILSLGKFFFFMLFGEKFLEGFSILPYYTVSILPLVLSLLLIGILTAVEKSITIVYIHIVSYYLGFIFLGLRDINSYLTYIFTLNFIFVLIYSCLILFACYIQRNEKLVSP